MIIIGNHFGTNVPKVEDKGCVGIIKDGLCEGLGRKGEEGEGRRARG
jgi:hypothetical protein